MQEINKGYRAKHFMGNQGLFTYNVNSGYLYPSHTEGKTGGRPPTTAKFYVVWGSLVTIVDDPATVLLTFRQVFADLCLIPDLSTTILMILVVEGIWCMHQRPPHDCWS